MRREILKKVVVQGIFVIHAFVIIFIFAGCGGEPERLEENSAESGRIALSITWKTQSADSSDIQNPDGTLNCENSDVAFVYAAVYDSDDIKLGDSGSQGWDCNMHSGVIEGIKAGEGRKIVILAKNQNDDVIFRGERNNITVTAGQTVKPEPVEAYPFSPELTNPESNSTITNGRLVFRWLDVPGASFYEISISTAIDFNDIIESQIISETTYNSVGLDSRNVYHWRVRALDNQGNEGDWSSIYSFYIEEPRNSSPVANAGPDQSGVYGQTITLNGSGSSDVDGDQLTYSWFFTSRPPGSAAALTYADTARPNFTIDVSGDYTIQLIVNDGTVNSAPDTVTISTNNSAPVANAGPDQSGVYGQAITLNGSGSSDVDGDSLTSYSWSFTSRPPGSAAALTYADTARPNFTIDVSGDYTIQLIVNDGTVDSAPDTVTISTNNSAPVADAGPDQTVLNGDLVTLDGSGSSDVDGDSLAYSWSFTSRPTGSNAALSNADTARPNFTIDVSGDYTIQLIVNDGTV
ncbi:MAG: PKD domain-containing protein, partial [Desulfobacterales bacterium]